jgi:hypothetical protein
MPVTTPIAKVDQEQLAEEPGQPEPLGVAGAHPGRLIAGDDRREADRDGNEEEVVDRDDPELPPCEVEGVHGGDSSQLGVPEGRASVNVIRDLGPDG